MKGAASSIVGADKGLSVDAQVGDKETDVQLGSTAKGARDIKAKDNAVVNVETKQTDTAIDSAKSVKIENVPPWLFLVALIGWILPTPQGMIAWSWKRLARKRVMNG